MPADPLITHTQSILDIVYKQTSMNFSNYKKATIWRRIEHRMNVNRYDDIEVYTKFLETNPEEVLNSFFYLFSVALLIILEGHFVGQRFVDWSDEVFP